MKKKAFDVYVGIGSSAGGFETLSELVNYLPEKTGFYYFVAQHHALGEKTILADLLNRNSKIETLLIEPGMLFKPDILYIIPPEIKLVVKKNRLSVEKIDVSHNTKPLPNADTLFNELSKLKHARAIAVVLSGTGHDGTEGMQSIKEKNGITIAQLPEEAIFDAMPKNAIEAKVVDYTLEIKDIATKLVKLANAFAEGTYVSEEIPFDEIVKILHIDKQLDLSKYKEDTINRRIQKRIEILKLTNIKEYAKYLKDNAQEIDILNKEVLIGVTEFFRGKEAFESLKEQLKKKLINTPEHSEFRVWSVACSSGEEAYTLAILLNEISLEINKHFYFKIFASDIDTVALERARDGEYKEKTLECLSSELISKYFLKTDYGYKVVKSLREQIVFAHHNFLNNPPFINIDLISCRNVLIYLKPLVQKDVFAIFHYSLNNDGLLFLGSSESTLSSLELFTTLDSKNRIYEKRHETKQSSFPNQVIGSYRKNTQKTRRQSMRKPISSKDIEKYLHDDIFKYFSNESLVVDSEFNIVYKKGNISYLNFSDGLLSLNLFENLAKPLHYEVRKLIKNVLVSNMKESGKFIQVDTDKPEKFVQVAAQPFSIPEYKTMVLLNFNEIESKDLLLNCIDSSSFNEKNVISALNSEISEAREDIQKLSEELTFSKQNMAMMNGELQDSNEKLQSTVEELETSNEELKSSNEELQVSLASNRELQNKLSLILESSMDGILGLDVHARHTFVNEKAAEMLGYTPEYLIGKDSHRLWHHTKADGSYFPEDECPIVGSLLEGKFGRREDLLWRKDGTSFPVELVYGPIMEDDKVVGAVVNFHDISEQRALEKQVKSEHELMLTYLETSGTIVLSLDLNGNILDVNNSGAKILGSSKKELIGLNWFETFIDETHRDNIKKVFNSLLDDNSKSVSHHVNKIIDLQKKEHSISWNNAKYKNEHGEVIGIITTGNDITQEEYLAVELQQSNTKYEQTFKAALVGISNISLDGTWIDCNEYFCNMVGYTKEELLKCNIFDLTHKDDLESDRKSMQKLLNKEIDTYRTEKRYVRKNGDIIWVKLSVSLLCDSSGNPLYFVSITQDISQIKMLMFELEMKKNEFENIIKFAPNPMMIYSEDGDVLMLNEAFKALTGYTITDIPTIRHWNKNLKGAKNITEKKIIDKMFKDNISIDEGQIQVYTKDKKVLTWIRSLAPLGNVHDDKKKVIYVATDITIMHEKEEMMLAQSRQAAMGDMIGMIAHQWRQPLSVIAMVANNLKADLDLEAEITDESLDEITKVLIEQTQSLSHTIEDFRTFFKPEKVKEKVNLCSVYEKLKSLIGKTMKNNEISLNFVKSCDVELYTFTNELIQVFINLLNNSKDAFKEKDIVNRKINIITHITKKSLKIEVLDNAGGIDKSVLSKLGEPYISTKNKNGTGLGIYMSKLILEKHFGGAMSWENRDKGSCFILELPIYDSARQVKK